MLSNVARASRRAVPPRRVVMRVRAARCQRQVLSQHRDLPRRALSTSTYASPDPSSSSPPPSLSSDSSSSSPLSSDTSVSSEQPPSSPPLDPLAEISDITLPPKDVFNEGAPRTAHSRAKRTAFVRTWKPVTNIADAYAMVHALERKFGSVIEFHFLRDFDIPTNYQQMGWLVFADPASLQRIPEDGCDFTMPSSGVTKELCEISLKDIEDVALPGEYDPKFEFLPVPGGGAGAEREMQGVIGGKIVRADKDYIPEQIDPHRTYQPTPKATFKAWLQWGGFTPLPPLSTPLMPDLLRPSELFDAEKLKQLKDERGVDHVRMRAAVQVAAGAVRMNNPLVVERQGQEGKEGGVGGVGGVEERKREAKEGSLGESVFSGLLDKEGAARASALDTPAPISLSSSPTTSSSTQKPPSQPQPTQKPKQKSTSQASQQPQKQKPKPTRPAPTPEEQAALARQLEVARQLRERVNMPLTHSHRKQPKPSLKDKEKEVRPKGRFIGAASMRGGVGESEEVAEVGGGVQGEGAKEGGREGREGGKGRREPELELYGEERIEQEVKNEKKGPGVLGKLFGFLKR